MAWIRKGSRSSGGTGGSQTTGAGGSPTVSSTAGAVEPLVADDRPATAQAGEVGEAPGVEPVDAFPDGSSGHRPDWTQLDRSESQRSEPNRAELNSATRAMPPASDSQPADAPFQFLYASNTPAQDAREGAARSMAEAWARSLRRFARIAVWTLPPASVCIALAGLWGWPTTTEPSGDGRGGTWLVVILAGVVLLVLGVVAITALLVGTPAGSWAAAATVGVVAGSILLAPVLGLVGLARPAGAALGEQVGAGLEQGLMDTTVSRWLGVGGLVLLAGGGVALGCAILAAGVLNRGDGFLVFVAVALAAGSAYAGWDFLLVIAALCLLAASLGLAWTASRITLDGVLRE